MNRMRLWRAGRYSLPLGEKTYIMAIVNVTPDSFSDGGKYFSTEQAIRRALDAQDQGADIIDIGAQSTRPGFSPISAEEEEEEAARLVPVLEGLRGRLHVPVSIDTFYPGVALESLRLGADILNDVTGFSDPEMIAAAAGADCGCIVMHNTAFSILPDAPSHDAGHEAEPITERVRGFFDRRGAELVRAGIAMERICFDPGIGFRKTLEENMGLLANTHLLTDGLDSAFLMAASRKRVIGAPCGDPPFEQRMPGTIAAHTIAQCGGADILRVHDVPEAVQAARVADALLAQRRISHGV